MRNYPKNKEVTQNVGRLLSQGIYDVHNIITLILSTTTILDQVDSLKQKLDKAKGNS